ncbi:MAG: hypothetical protein IPK80_04550 [Nannocystis sp.]|nr:hypothetical protein [Nannocystis sp.]
MAVAGRPGWLRSPRFDLSLIVGVLALALVMGGAAWARPELFGALLLVDLWLLAYPHVAATFLKISLTREDRRRWRFLMIGLPPLVLLGTGGLAWAGGATALFTAYYFWQSWHYTRQSYGIARAYGWASGGADRWAEVVVYTFPLWGLLSRAHAAPAEFYGAAIVWPPVPGWAVWIAATAAMGALFGWGARRLRAHARGDHRGGPAGLFVLSHVLITAVAYLWIEEITYGWFFLNIWHNAQYSLFLWANQARRFAGAQGPERRLAARVFAAERFGLYAGLCLIVGGGFYGALGAGVALIPAIGLPTLLIVHLSVNFHHYLIDAAIWRPRPASATGTAALG